MRNKNIIIVFVGVLAIILIFVAKLSNINPIDLIVKDNSKTKYNSQNYDKDEQVSPYYFRDNVAVTKICTIKITDCKIIHPGEKGNELGSKPLFLIYFDTTNTSGDSLTPTVAWAYIMDVYQDNDPNIINKLNTGIYLNNDDVNNLLSEIKQDGTVSSCIAYELSDLETPVELVAKEDIAGAEIGSMIYNLEDGSSQNGSADDGNKENSAVDNDTINDKPERNGWKSGQNIKDTVGIYSIELPDYFEFNREEYDGEVKVYKTENELVKIEFQYATYDDAELPFDELKEADFKDALDLRAGEQKQLDILSEGMIQLSNLKGAMTCKRKCHVITKSDEEGIVNCAFIVDPLNSKGMYLYTFEQKGAEYGYSDDFDKIINSICVTDN